MKHRILVVEDEPAVSRGVRDALSFNGYVVDVAADGETGYQLARENHFDMIVLDLMLPRLGGLDMLAKLRGENIQTPVLILTARGQESDRDKGLALGADAYVVKPFDPEALRELVREMLARTSSE